MKKRLIAEYFLYFVLYSVIGWIYEVFLEVVVYRWGFTNRGVLFGPWLPVYGTGALLFLLLWYRLLHRKPARERLKFLPAIFLLTMLTATALELITSYLCEWTIGTWPWQTYVSYPLNFQGRIALNPSIRFGLGGVFFLYVLQPLFERLRSRLSDRQLLRLSAGLSVLFVCDAALTLLLR